MQLPFDPAIAHPAIYPRGRHVCLYKILYTIFHGSFTYNSQNLEITKTFLNEWMVKQTVVYSYWGIRFSKKKEQINDTQLEWISGVLCRVIKANLTRSFMKGKISTEMENDYNSGYVSLHML